VGNSPRPVAPLSVDLDDHWAYLRTRGDRNWESAPSYLQLAVPRLLTLLERHGIRCTFFLVGKDAAMDRNRELFARIAASGHEIANHSFEHEPWLHLYRPGDLADDLRRSHDTIAAATSSAPVGFRGPGYSLAPTLVPLLHRMGYLYDASVCPNLLAPVARNLYLRGVHLTPEQMAQRRQLGGSFLNGFGSIRPYFWRFAENARLLEIPVTTFPGLKIPFHPSYIGALGATSLALARTYFSAAVLACRATGVRPSLVIHPPDILGADDDSGIGFLSGMSLSAVRKMELLEFQLRTLSRYYTPVALRNYARELRDTALPVRTHP